MSTAKPVSDPPSLEQQRLLVSRILSSALFRKSRKLATFLQFICEQQQMGKADSINEQRIGTEVFGRNEGYHMGEDSIVRSQARFLRIRLQEYFATEGKDEPIVLTIPKGSYVPEFHLRELPAETVQTVATLVSHIGYTASTPSDKESSEPPPKRSFFWIYVAAGIGAVVCLALGIGWWLRGEEHRHAGVPVEVRFWASIFDSQRTIILVPADSSLVLMDELIGNEITLSDYMNRKYRSTVPPPEMTRIWNQLLTSQYTNVVDLRLVSALERLPEVDHSKTQVRFARDVSVSELKQNNVILIGSTRANPWVDLFSSAGRFRVGYDSKTHTNLVENRNPGQGEKARYDEAADSADHLAYGVISYLPSLDGESSSLLIGGTSKAGTETASEFLLSPRFITFLHTLDKGGALPHFEILLSAQNLNGNSYQRTIVCYHIL
ncbi:hypothetical protein FTW19_04210 [Terriglobus albidus]|uniref:Uncharacterized protein n=1 Tax=Terriglobus albidus TaxID=1592106 RepID=A0A5B9E6Q8_9BACT|nr:hypothetical protein [Terriglobus albidus]QEE27284.1 hypothetical protein FTW19_04210 [Terriglobus albidus]